MWNPDLSVANDVIRTRWAEDGFPEEARDAVTRGLHQVQTVYGIHAHKLDLQDRGICKIYLDEAAHLLHPNEILSPGSLLHAVRDIFVVHAYCAPGLVTSRITDLGPCKKSYDKLIQRLVRGMHPLEKLAALEGHDDDEADQPVPR